MTVMTYKEALNQLNVLKAGNICTWRGDHGGHFRLVRQNRRRQVHPLVGAGQGLLELVQNRLLHTLRQFHLIHQGADEVSVALLRGNPAGRSVRLLQVAQSVRILPVKPAKAGASS